MLAGDPDSAASFLQQADAPDLDYKMAAEIVLLIETLEKHPEYHNSQAPVRERAAGRFEAPPYSVVIYDGDSGRGWAA